ncbi:MAG: thiamine diphosphokinase [Acidimicrobiia bacterium]
MGATASDGSWAVVFAGGDPPPPHALDHLPLDARVVAADSGLVHALAAGLRVDLLVGDLDSTPPRMVLDALDAGTEVQRHPAGKDATDLELALEAVRARGITDVLVVGIHGGRADHLLANALLLASPRYAPMRVHAHLGNADVLVIRGGDAPTELPGPAGRLCTLLPIGGPAEGVVTSGLRWRLADETLPPGTSRGVSNEIEELPATVALREGVLLAVLPDPEFDLSTSLDASSPDATSPES